MAPRGGGGGGRGLGVGAAAVGMVLGGAGLWGSAASGASGTWGGGPQAGASPESLASLGDALGDSAGGWVRYTAGMDVSGGGGLVCPNKPFEEVAVGGAAAVRLFRCRAPGPPPEEKTPPGEECSAVSWWAPWAARVVVCGLVAGTRAWIKARGLPP